MSCFTACLKTLTWWKSAFLRRKATKCKPADVDSDIYSCDRTCTVIITNKKYTDQSKTSHLLMKPPGRLTHGAFLSYLSSRLTKIIKLTFLPCIWVPYTLLWIACLMVSSWTCGLFMPYNTSSQVVFWLYADAVLLLFM